MSILAVPRGPLILCAAIGLQLAAAVPTLRAATSQAPAVSAAPADAAAQTPSPAPSPPSSGGSGSGAPAATVSSAAGTAPADTPVFYETATVQARPLSSATGSVTVLDRQDVERSGARTIGELMRFIPGVDILTNGARGGNTLAEIRGGDEKSMVLIDGVPVDDPTNEDGDVFNLEGVPADEVERIEVVRGPLSSFFGSSGLSGVVNVITRQGQAGRTAAQLAAAGGNASLRQTNGSVGGGLGPGAYLLGGGWEEESHRVALDDFRQLNLYGNASEPVADETRVRLNGRYSQWHADDYPDASGGPLFGDGLLRSSDHTEESLSAELDLDGGGHPSRLHASVYRHDLDQTSPAILDQVPAETQSTAFTQLRAGGTGTLYAGERLQWSGGVDLGQEQGDNRSLLLDVPFAGDVHGDYHITRNLYGAFTEALLEERAFTLELGGRLDRVTGPGTGGDRTEADPRLGLTWRLGGSDTRLHASAGRAFKLPSFFALASPRALGGNPNLRPEIGTGGDAGIDHRFARAHLDLDATLFYDHFRDLIDFDFQQFLHVNRSSVEARGAELSLAWRPTPRLAAALNATWQQVQDLTPGDGPLLHRPRWIGGGHVDWQASPRLHLRLDTQAVSRYLDTEIPVPDRDSVPSYQLLGAGATWQLTHAWQLRTRIDNLADRRYQVLVGFPGPGPALRLGVQYTL
jgi:vitamin B12 transporter